MPTLKLIGSGLVSMKKRKYRLRPIICNPCSFISCHRPIGTLINIGTSTAPPVTSVLTVPVSYRVSAFGLSMAPTAVPPREATPSPPGRWIGEKEESLNTVLARVVARGWNRLDSFTHLCVRIRWGEDDGGTGEGVTCSSGSECG